MASTVLSLSAKGREILENAIDRAGGHCQSCHEPLEAEHTVHIETARVLGGGEPVTVCSDCYSGICGRVSAALAGRGLAISRVTDGESL